VLSVRVWKKAARQTSEVLKGIAGCTICCKIAMQNCTESDALPVRGRLPNSYSTRSSANHNQQAFGPHIEFAPLFIPETSGGLLISVPEAEAQGLLHRLEEGGDRGWIIGEVVEGEGIEVV